MAIVTADHGALMDDVYRRQRYVYDFTRKYYLFGRDRLIHGLALKPEESVVEIGCGTARNLIVMARRYPKAVLYGLDASEEMLRSARRAVAHAGLTNRISLARGFAEDMTPAIFARKEPFDRAVFSYSLSMIPNWKQSLKAASAALSPTGLVHIVDFGDMTGMGSLGRCLLTLWLQLFHVSPRVEILEKIESGGTNYLEQIMRLQLLTARYAFIWQGSRNAAERLSL